MQDVAKLAVAVDTSQVEGATTDLNAFAGAAKGADAAATGLGAKTKATAPSMKQTGDAAQRAGMQIRGAGMHTANLGAQFNDIGVMLAAGQNPLMLALQQGTQVNQVFAQMDGNTSRLRALGSAFASVISPVNLATIGIIAGGAALAQWALSAIGANKETLTYEENLENLSDAVAEYRKLSSDAALSTSDLRDRFGEAGAEARSILVFLENIAKSEAQRQIDEISASLSELMGIRGSGEARAGIAEFFDVNIMLAFTDAQRQARSEARELTAEFYNQQQALANSNGDLSSQIIALERMREAATQLSDMDGQRTAAEDEILSRMGQTLVIMYEQQAATSTHNAALSQQEFLLRSQIGLNANRRDIIQQIAEAEQDYQSARARQQARDEAAASSVLASLRQQSQMSAMIALFGAESAEVALLRADHERQSFEAMLATLDVSEGLKRELMEAFNAVQLIENANPAGPIAAAASAAAQLASNLGISVQHASRLLTLRGNQTGEVIFDPRDPRYDATRAEMARLAENPNRISPFDPIRNRAPRSSGGGRSGGGGTSEAQRLHNEMTREAERIYDQTRNALEKYTAEVADLNELHEMGYLDAETLGRAMAELNEEFRRTEFGPLISDIDSFSDSFGDMIAQAENLGDVFRGLGDVFADTLARMASEWASRGMNDILTALVFGAGGGTTTTGFGSLLSGLFGGFRAQGGPVSSGKGYIVGENGPEWFSPGTSGMITPNHAMGGATTVDVRVSMDNNGNLQAYVAGVANQAGQQAVQQAGKNIANDPNYGRAY